MLPYMGYIGIWGLKGYCFSDVLVINKVSILAILGLNRVVFLLSIIIIIIIIITLIIVIIIIIIIMIIIAF